MGFDKSGFHYVSPHSTSRWPTLPAALLLLLWLKSIRIDIKRWLQIAPYVVLGLVIVLIVVWFEYHHQGTGKVDLSTNPIERGQPYREISSKQDNSNL